MSGITVKFGLQPPVYLTGNWDEAGELFEIFLMQGKQGGTDFASAAALGMAVSEVLRLGGDPGRLADKFRGMKGMNPVWDKGELLLSMPDCVGRFLQVWKQYREVHQGVMVDLEEFEKLLYPRAEE